LMSHISWYYIHAAIFIAAIIFSPE
jgi:hypothetical protein